MAAFPSITPSSVSLVPMSPTRITKTINGITQTQATGGDRFQMTVNFTGLNQAEVRQIKSHIIAQGGPLQAFEFTLPDYIGDSTGAYSSTITLSSSVAAGATSCSVTSTGSTFPSLKAGDLIRFVGHEKLYTLSSDVTSPGTTLSFYPAARKSVSNGTNVTHQNLTVYVRYVGEMQQILIGVDQFSNFSLQFEEVLT